MGKHKTIRAHAILPNAKIVATQWKSLTIVSLLVGTRRLLDDHKVT